MDYISRLTHITEQLIQQNTYPSSIKIIIGELIGISDEQLYEQWSKLTQKTQLAQTSLTIQRTPTHLQCMACFEKYQPTDQKTLCPICGSVGAKILAGEEFKIETINE